ncbi:hypothetical protein SY89_00226 [Halolamina pelagica]|uniref:Uncharacterized protein n=1 Tax=Halolamina pelagica TaxID=699431 RepID=A0A0P7G8C5_9EURY|nr:hypothetical protein [Halolamina pelagica]KPN29513.1 hypothetical protein SY89_00226 [Halolamina pelagica]
MATGPPSNDGVEEQLLEALDEAENQEVRYHIRETLQHLHLDD